jgi:hypothetical protein
MSQSAASTIIDAVVELEVRYVKGVGESLKNNSKISGPS